ncbi:catalase-related peroxidase [Planotetraspora thailandica]|uniref:Catalase-related peroxidase n=1 Tax=Planotetraspora thailandica TaxID=487172 RepID=A0A8J3UZI5_9ACTN|nr:catalase family peroxidase [Planotetraspora thailandica]GII52737.1 catalase-related peroxidase [Planotetraspora thailandica]
MSSDTALPPTPVQVVDSMERMSGGTYPGYRRSGARGVCFKGTFTPTGDAMGLTTAAHLQRRPVPVTVRFSNSEGNPQARDGVPVARGMATRFALPDGGDTDLIALSVPVFVASTPEEFLTLTEALRPDAATGHPDPARVQAFVAAHPHLAEPITQQPPVPVSYGSAAYWAIHTFVWVDAAGNRQPVRYRWEPEAGRMDLTAEEAATRADHYLTAELHERLQDGPVAFTLQVQLGEEGDPTHDPTVAWPETRKEITAGRLELTAPVDDQERWAAQGFNPTWVTAGIELSDDPVLAFRAGAYPESLRRRGEHR